MWPASVSTAARRVSRDTPVHVVPSLDHLVTQWMSTVTFSDGSARNSSHGHDTGSATAPLIVKLHSSRGVRGVGPADRTGKSLTTYWPGGTRSGSTCGRRPRKPREISAMTVLLSFGPLEDPGGALDRNRRRRSRDTSMAWLGCRVAPDQGDARPRGAHGRRE